MARNFYVTIMHGHSSTVHRATEANGRVQVRDPRITGVIVGDVLIVDVSIETVDMMIECPDFCRYTRFVEADAAWRVLKRD